MADEQNTIIVSDKLEQLETASKDAITSIHENMEELIAQAHLVEVTTDTTPEQYEQVKTLWRTLKDTHIGVEKKRKELKAPVVEYGKKLDAFAKEIYEPLVTAEKAVRNKMKVFEEEQERVKAEKKQAEKEAQEAHEALAKKLHELNATLGRINQCTVKHEVETIEKELDAIDLKSYGERSDEAGFILQNLKLTCKTIKNALPDGASLEEQAKGADWVEKDAVRAVKNLEKKIEQEAPELDFGSVGSVNNNVNSETPPVSVEEEIKQMDEVVSQTPKIFFTDDEEHNIKQGSVIPLSITDVDENNAERVIEILTVTSISKGNGISGGLPSKANLTINFPDGTHVTGTYTLTTIND
jgi:hypothetical protein